MVTRRVGQSFGVGGCKVGQGIALEMAPEHLDRIDIGCVRRQEVTVQLAVTFEEPVDDFRSVGL